MEIYMKRCYIVGAGSFYGSFIPEEGDLVIAADGGYDILLSKNIRCDLLIGDLDSVKSKSFEGEILRHPVEKDETDMHLAYLEGKRRGYGNFVIFGGTGGRPDHTFANYSLLSYIKNNGDDATLMDDGYATRLIKNEATRVQGEPGKTLSVFAYGGVASGVTLRGLYYPLENGELTPSFALGVSNKFTGDEAEISVESGELLLIFEIRG
jgi:thiamine pyrophosphokinase